MLVQLATASSPENNLAFFAALALAAGFVWVLYRQYFRTPPTPDPWDDEVSQAMENDEAVPLCPHCLTSHEHTQHFCLKCGGPVGAYTNLMPFEYCFSVGHLLRIGTDGNFRRSPLLILGFIILSTAEYAIFAPFYWLRLLLNLSRMTEQNHPDSPE